MARAWIAGPTPAIKGRTGRLARFGEHVCSGGLPGSGRCAQRRCGRCVVAGGNHAAYGPTKLVSANAIPGGVHALEDLFQPDDVLGIAPFLQRGLDCAAREVETPVPGATHEPDGTVARCLVGVGGKGDGVGRSDPVEIAPPVDGEAVAARERPPLDIGLEVVRRGRPKLIGAKDDDVAGSDCVIDGTRYFLALRSSPTGLIDTDCRSEQDKNCEQRHSDTGVEQGDTTPGQQQDEGKGDGGVASLKCAARNDGSGSTDPCLLYTSDAADEV